jgi:hypothetical protein
MPRTSTGGNGGLRLFHKPGDYQAFEKVLAEGMERYAVEVLTWSGL